MSTHSPHDEIAALAAAVWRDETSSRDLLLEVLLSRLLSHAPDTAKLVASVLRARGDQVGKSLGEQLHLRVGEYEGRELDAPAARLVVNYLILTIKAVEYSACLRAFGVAEGAPKVDLGNGLEVALVTVDGASFAIGMAGPSGNVESAIVLGGLCALIDFEASILVGMAAGVRGEVNLGDVVVAEEVLAYEYAEMTLEGPLLAPRSYGAPNRMIRRVGTLQEAAPAWAREISRSTLDIMANEPESAVALSEWPVEEDERLDANWRPHERRGVILAGAKLFEDGSLPRMRAEYHARVKAVEMDGAGYAAASVEKSKPWLVIRGIADYGEPGRRKHWQFPATYAASLYLRQVLRHRRVEF